MSSSPPSSPASSMLETPQDSKSPPPLPTLNLSSSSEKSQPKTFVPPNFSFSFGQTTRTTSASSTCTSQPTKPPASLFSFESDKKSDVSSSLMPQAVKPLPAEEKLVAKLPSRQPHPEFSFDDGIVTFAVEDTSFTVHRFFFNRDSLMFQRVFAQPDTNNNTSGRGTKEDPFVLEGISCLEFERFLKVLYPSRFNEHQFQTAEEWQSVLHVADFFQFSQSGIRELSIDRLQETASAIQKAAWGAKYGSKTLLIAGYRELCNRRDCLTAAELSQLSFQAIELISSKREHVLRASRCARCINGGFKSVAAEDDVTAHFAELLKNAQ